MHDDDNSLRGEPTTWLVLFHTSTGRPWLDRAIPGRFKHVSAAAWIDETRTWVFYDCNLWRTGIKVLPQEAGDMHYALAQRGAGVLKMPPLRGGRLLFRFGFWCVPAVKHLLGCRSGALQPSGLWRDLVRQGAEIVQDVQLTTAVGADRAGAAGGARRA